MVKEGGVNLISKRKARLIEFLPEKIVIKIARRTIDGYLSMQKLMLMVMKI